ARLKQWIRTCAFNRYFCNYFPVKLVKTTDLDPNKSYLFCNFPHGLICLGVYCAFGTDAAGFRELFPGLDINIIMRRFSETTAASIVRIIQIRILQRDYCVDLSFTKQSAVASSSAESVNLLLSTKPEARYSGRATVLIVGGAAEATESKPGTYRILIKRRKGFKQVNNCVHRVKVKRINSLLH
ncbi:hypothetical protein E2986_11660, partial [Frieseomelitta varia]